MKQADDKSWVEKFGVTVPIKNILSCVDALEESYERRLSAVKQEFQQDIEAIVDCYKEEKQRFLKMQQYQMDINQQQEYKIETLNAEISELQRIYKKEHIEHKFTKDSLNIVRSELEVLTAALKNEQEIINITEQRIKTAQTQIQHELARQPAPKSRNFFMQIFESRIPATQKPDADTATS